MSRRRATGWAAATATLVATLAVACGGAQSSPGESQPASESKADTPEVTLHDAPEDVAAGLPEAPRSALSGLGPLDALPVAPPRLAAEPASLEGKAIVVDQSLQVMAVFEDGLEIRRMAVSTGRPTYNTYTLPWNGYVGRYVGTFQSRTGGKADEAWYLYEATGSILIHGAPYYLVDGEKQYYELDALGNYPASDGCIRLAPEDARWLTEWGPYNVPITITELPGEIAGLVTSG